MAAPEIAKQFQHQVVESEHLLKALLEQPNGLARRIIARAGGDPTRILEHVDTQLGAKAKVYGSMDQV